MYKPVSHPETFRQVWLCFEPKCKPVPKSVPRHYYLQYYNYWTNVLKNFPDCTQAHCWPAFNKAFIEHNFPVNYCSCFLISLLFWNSPFITKKAGSPGIYQVYMIICEERPQPKSTLEDTLPFLSIALSCLLIIFSLSSWFEERFWTEKRGRWLQPHFPKVKEKEIMQHERSINFKFLGVTIQTIVCKWIMVSKIFHCFWWWFQVIKRNIQDVTKANNYIRCFVNNCIRCLSLQALVKGKTHKELSHFSFV